MSMKTKTRTAAEVAAELRREAKTNDLCGSPEWSALLNEAAQHLEVKHAMFEALKEMLAMATELLPLAPTGCGWGTIALDNAGAALKLAGGGE